MIERFRLLTIHSSRNEFDLLVTNIRKSIFAPWSYGELKNQDFGIDAKAASFLYRKGALREANLWLNWYDGKITIGNIVPTEYGQLSRGEYNALFDDFVTRFLLPAAEIQSLQVELTGAHRDISEWLSESTKRKLSAFSSLANKSTGHSHPSDHARWIDFVIGAHVENADLPTDVLEEWLVNELHWPETSAMDLASDFEAAIDLLQRYDEAK
ncbi:hypothetical protein GOC56_32725 [Sinorhizobium meliloti]|nr:hypothetical protein [Sinorhizobium meliloti]